jgi:hypothetical protein
VNTIITHITNGNQNEERLVNVMGGTIIETESERLKRLGKADECSRIVQHMLRKGKTPEEIAELCGYDLSYVQEIQEGMAVTV